MGAKEPARKETSIRGDEERTVEVLEVSGSIKWFDPSAGYGFIVPDDDLPDVLLHVTCLRRDGFQTAYEGARVVCEVQRRPQGLQVLRICAMDDSTAINPSEAVQEKVSLSDRFGLWLGFHHCSQDDYLAMIEGYAQHYKLKVTPDELRAKAIEWTATRGSRSGRVAWQFEHLVALAALRPLQLAHDHECPVWTSSAGCANASSAALARGGGNPRSGPICNRCDMPCKESS